MGTRINYLILAAGQSLPAAVLFSNSHHDTEDPELAFRDCVSRCTGQTDLVATLLSEQYSTAHGNHRVGDRMFSIDLYPQDHERVLSVVFSSDGEPPSIVVSETLPTLSGLIRDYSDTFRALASWLGAGGFNSEGLIDPKVAEDKIRWGVNDACRMARLMVAPPAKPDTGTSQADTAHNAGWNGCRAETLRLALLASPPADPVPDTAQHQA